MNKSKEDLLALADWYYLLAENGNGFMFKGKESRPEAPYSGPNLQSTLSNYAVNPKNPKFIDLTPLIGSDIDMEFSNTDNLSWVTGLLTNIIRNESNPSLRFTRDNSQGWFEKCRIREDHWHHWSGGDCPIPEGLEYTIELRNGGRIMHGGDTSEVQWRHGHPDQLFLDVIGFEITGVKAGWQYDWGSTHA